MPKAMNIGGMLRPLATFLVVFVIVTLATLVWKRRGEQTPVDMPQVIETQVNRNPMAVLPSEVLTESRQLPELSAWVLYGGEAHASNGGQVALPSGARFTFRVSSNVDGRLVFYTINPKGVTSDRPLWESDIMAGEMLEGPGLTLQGSRGLETLRVLLTPAAGGDTIERHLQIEHGR